MKGALRACGKGRNVAQQHKWPLVLPPAATVSCPSLRRTWAVRSAPALTTSSAGAAAAGLAHFHGTFASASISALPGLLVCSAGPFRSTRSALRVGLRLPPGRSGGRIGPRLVSLSLALAALLARNRSWLRTGLPAAWLLPLPLRPEHTCEGAARWLRGRRCFAEPPFPPFPGLGLPPCPWRFGWRFSPGWWSFPASFRPDFHQSSSSALTGSPATPFADFNSYPKARICVFNGDNRFIPLAFLPPSIPGYR